MDTGYVVLGDHQRFYGYTLFLCKRHVTEIFHLPQAEKLRHLVAAQGGNVGRDVSTDA